MHMLREDSKVFKKDLENLFFLYKSTINKSVAHA